MGNWGYNPPVFHLWHHDITQKTTQPKGHNPQTGRELPAAIWVVVLHYSHACPMVYCMSLGKHPSILGLQKHDAGKSRWFEEEFNTSREGNRLFLMMFNVNRLKSIYHLHLRPLQLTNMKPQEWSGWGITQIPGCFTGRFCLGTFPDLSQHWHIIVCNDVTTSGHNSN